MTFVRNDCRSIKRYAIFKFVTQFRLLRRECGHLWRANFHVDIQYSFMSYRHTFINCLFFYSHSTNQLRNQIVFSNYFHYSLLVWIFGMERLPLKNVNLADVVFLLNPADVRPFAFIRAWMDSRGSHSSPVMSTAHDDVTTPLTPLYIPVV